MPYGYYRPYGHYGGYGYPYFRPGISPLVRFLTPLNRYASSASPLMTSRCRRGSFSLASLAGAAPPLRNCACCKK